jgi:hypothetical protein
MKKVKLAILAVFALIAASSISTSYATPTPWVGIYFHCTTWEILGTIGNEWYICRGGYFSSHP